MGDYTGTKLVLWTNDEKALAWYRKINTRLTAFKASANDFLDAVTDEIGTVDGKRNAMTVRGRIVGVAPSTAEVRKPPVGWRIDRMGVLVPHKGTKSGKAWAAKIDALPFVYIRDEAEEIGIPSMAIDGFRFLEPGIDYDYDYVKEDAECTAIYQLWSSESALADIEQLETKTGIHWNPMKLSEWYARLESK